MDATYSGYSANWMQDGRHGERAAATAFTLGLGAFFVKSAGPAQAAAPLLLLLPSTQKEMVGEGIPSVMNAD